MNQSSSFEEGKLELLQAIGKGRPWASLDEWRRCQGCGQMIVGRQIWVEHDAAGGSRLRCPTPGCPAIWAEAGESEGAADADWSDWVRLLDTLGDSRAGWRRALRRIHPLKR